MDITYTLSERDYYAANRAHVMLVLSNGTGLIIPVLTGGFCALVIASDNDLALSPWTRMGLGVAITLTVAALFWLLMVVLTLLTLPRRSRNLYRQQRILGEETRANWNEQEFWTESESATNRLPWTDFLRWAETDDVMLLLPNDMMFYALPKRAMDEPTRAALIARLDAHAVPRWRRWRSLWRPTRKAG